MLLWDRHQGLSISPSVFVDHSPSSRSETRQEFRHAFVAELVKSFLGIAIPMTGWKPIPHAFVAKLAKSFVGIAMLMTG